MNSLLKKLQPYPFERLKELLAGLQPPAELAPLNLSIGEPKHATPALIKDALVANLSGLAGYPATAGTEALRVAIADWLKRRYGLRALDPLKQVLPINGSREALFAFAQTVVDAGGGARVVCPNPFYQIYEGAALLAGAEPFFVEQSPDNDFRIDWQAVPEAVWARTQLLYVCSPGNPTGAVLTLDEWRWLFEMADRHGFAIAADECYSEIYFDEAAAPLGALQAAQALGRDDYRGLVVFSSLSKRSNAPGMRSGFVAGDAELLRPFLLYRTYHGSAMSLPVQAASVAAWRDETHVVDNRRLYREKFDAVTPLVAQALQTARPEAGFYLWARVPDGDDLAFCRRLYAQYNVLVLPGSFLSREHQGRNPGRGFVRIALVDSLASCVEAAHRLQRLAQG
ncbi:MAG: succinyldiaminopimelate transaminase [Burkholderiaceae bacterium]